MRRVALALLLSLDMMASPATAKGGAPPGGSNAGQGGNLSDAQQYYQRGLAEVQSGQDAAAIADFEKSIKLDPDRFETYQALDGVLAKQRKWAIAVQHWDQYIQLHPDDGRAYCEQGGAYSWLHDVEHMQADAEKACSLGNQKCCQIVGAHKGSLPQASPPAAESERVPLMAWPLLAMWLSFPVLLVVYFIRGPKASGSLDLWLKSGALSGGLLILLYFTHILNGAFLPLLFSVMTPGMLGVFLFARGFARYREFRAVLTTPESAIQGLAMGFVEVHGKAAGTETVLSPVSLTPCFFYKVFLEGKGGEGPDFIKVDVGGTPFYLEDATGKVRVDPTGVECDLLLNKEARFKLTGWRKINVTDTDLISYANNLDISWDVSACHFLEYCVLPGHWYDLAGTCVENPNPQDLLDRNLIVKGQEERTFRISWRTEEGVKATVRRRAAYDIFIGGALILVGAAFGLALIGQL